MSEADEILDANCPTERWWELARTYPLEAEASVLFPMLTLETPERWAKLEDECLGVWVEKAAERLDPAWGHSFAADCAEHVLPLWEHKEPTEKSPHEAIWQRRLYAMTIGSDSEKTFETRWREAMRVANREAHGLFRRVSYGGSIGLDYAGEAAEVAATEEIYWVIHKAAMAVGKRAVVLFVGSGYGGSRTPEEGRVHDIGKRSEYRWQWTRLRAILEGKAI